MIRLWGRSRVNGGRRERRNNYGNYGDLHKTINKIFVNAPVIPRLANRRNAGVLGEASCELRSPTRIGWATLRFLFVIFDLFVTY